MPDSTEKGVNVTINFATKNRKETKIMTKKLMEELELLDSISKSRETLVHFANDVAKLKNGTSMPKYKAVLDGIDALDLEFCDVEEKAQKEIKDSISYKIENAMHDIVGDFLEGYDARAIELSENAKEEIEADVEMIANDLAWNIIYAVSSEDE